MFKKLLHWLGLHIWKYGDYRDRKCTVCGEYQKYTIVNNVHQWVTLRF